MKPRVWVTLITLVLLAAVIALGWHDITQAWAMVGKVDFWILSLMIPVQILSYFATGQVVFSYLRSKGDLEKTSRWKMARLALELNFVNHVLPSGITASFAYLGWVLGREGVTPGRATMAQTIRYALTFLTYVGILIVSVALLAFDREADRAVVATSAALVAIILFIVFTLIYATSNHERLVSVATWVTRLVNRVVSFLTFRRKSHLLSVETVEHFLGEFYEDRRQIREDLSILIRPALWAVVLNCLDVSLLFIAFASLGFTVNPAIIAVAFGLSSVVSILSVAPGGAGVYEAAMILFLASAGVPRAIAIAGTLLARVVLLLGTVLFGYVFYQLTINKFGEATTKV